MRKLHLTFALIALGLIANCQVTNNVQAMVAGYNAKDTIPLEDFCNIKQLSVNSNEYTIAKYAFTFGHGGYIYNYLSPSNRITEQIKTSFDGFRDKDEKYLRVFFCDIIVRNFNGEKSKISDLTYILKIK